MCEVEEVMCDRDDVMCDGYDVMCDGEDVSSVKWGLNGRSRCRHILWTLGLTHWPSG